VLQDVSALHIVRNHVSRCAVVDLETRLLETTVSFLAISDPWNFGHGRYMSLMVPSVRSGILVTGNFGSDRALARVANTIPRQIPLVRIGVPGDSLFDALVCWFRMMWFLDAFSEARGIDPGELRPPAW